MGGYFWKSGDVMRRALACLVEASMVVLAIPALAQARPAPDRENANYDVVVTQTTQMGNHQGIRASVWFGRGNDDRTPHGYRA